MEMMLVLSAASGWAAVMLLIAATAAPYFARPTALARAFNLAGTWTTTFLERMRPHASLGYIIITLSALHGAVALGSGIERVDALGLWLAAVGLSLLLVQWRLGTRLLRPTLQARRLVRRQHFAVMLAAGAAILAHAYLNGALLRTVFQ